jgi:hypothetical protein
MNLRKEENVFFATSMFEIDRKLEARAPPTRTDVEVLAGSRWHNETELQWLERVLSSKFTDYADVFSQEASNELPSHRPYDHAIKIEDLRGPESLKYSLLH